jgi:hypothetical protein
MVSSAAIPRAASARRSLRSRRARRARPETGQTLAATRIIAAIATITIITKDLLLADDPSIGSAALNLESPGRRAPVLSQYPAGRKRKRAEAIAVRARPDGGVSGASAGRGTIARYAAR